ncbi:MAG: LptE family protein [Bdellovibrionaceae bacterium]|nr:LptE family protein [Pseudobdellovibrionaceae bacterium]
MSKILAGLLFGVMILYSGCAYKVGQKFRSLPGGYQRLSIPVFKNKSMEPGAEAILTQALKEEFFRSTVLKVVSDNEAEVRLEGQIEALRYDPTSTVIESDQKNQLPTGTVLTSSYIMNVILNVKLVKTATAEVLWQSQFSSSRQMSASQVTYAGINSVNPIYNQNAKRIVLESVAYELSNQIHNNLTENF